METPGVVREKYGKYIIHRNEKYIEVELCFWITLKVELMLWLFPWPLWVPRLSTLTLSPWSRF